MNLYIIGFSEEFNHKFWKDFRNTVKKPNPEAIILAEHYGDYSWWLEGDEWDTTMNYDAFMEPLRLHTIGAKSANGMARGTNTLLWLRSRAY